nr:MAG TPA: hypothetical protein [Bacteriophage sp.]
MIINQSTSMNGSTVIKTTATSYSNSTSLSIPNLGQYANFMIQLDISTVNGYSVNGAVLSAYVINGTKKLIYGSSNVAASTTNFTKGSTSLTTGTYATFQTGYQYIVVMWN